MKTKRAKTITATFYPVGEPFEAVVRAWAEELSGDHRFVPDDPLFRATNIAPGETGLFGARGLERRPWTSAGPIREIFRRTGGGRS